MLRYTLGVFLAMGLLSCSLPRNLVNDKIDISSGKDIKQIVSLLDSGFEKPAEEIVFFESAVNKLRHSKESNLTPALLTNLLLRSTSPNYKAYYFYLLAEYYRSTSQDRMAALYYERAYKTDADVFIKNESIHKKSIEALLKLPVSNRQKIEFLEFLLEHFPESERNVGLFYQLATFYEKEGLYSKSLDAYRKFSDRTSGVTLGFGKEIQRAQEILQISATRMDWTRENLVQLVAEIRNALTTKNANALVALQAKVNFFSMSWLQEKADFNSQVSYNFRRFVELSPRIYAESFLDPSSNSQEAYLKTWGWSTYIPTWYLYFRRVDYPANPEINGNWEWAGIYFGDSLQ